MHIRANFWNHIGIDKFEQESKYEMNFSSRRQMSVVKLNVLTPQYFTLHGRKDETESKFGAQKDLIVLTF